MAQFKDYSLRPELHKALDKLGIHTPTPIQEQALAHLLDPEHIDFHGQAQTGTGKTLAFGLPLLHKLDIDNVRVQALIVAPTRELVVQITEALNSAAALLPLRITPVYGGVSMVNQLRELRRGTHIVVGTPGRLNDHLRRGTLSLKNVHTIVLDEADIMLDMGFKQEVDEILSHAPEERRIWLFSATIKSGIEQIKKNHMKNVVAARATPTVVTVDSTKQYYCTLPRKNRVTAIGRFIDQAPDFYGFVFCPTKLLASEVAEALSGMGYPASALHGDMNQTLRNAVIKKFKQKSFSVLVATDVAARGIDVSGITHVINYSLPEDHESYVHRIGRTGRAGLEGIAITLVNRNEVGRLSRVAKKFSASITPLDVPRVEDIAVQRMDQAMTYIAAKSTQQENAPSHVNTLREKLVDRSKDELMTAVAHLLAENFFAGLNHGDDFSNHSTPSFEACKQENDGTQEVMLNVGTDDNVTESDILDRILTCKGVEPGHILKMRVIKRRTFVTFPEEQANTILHEMRGVRLGGMTLRPVRVYDERDDRSSFRGGRRRPSQRGGSRGGNGGRRDMRPRQNRR